MDKLDRHKKLGEKVAGRLSTFNSLEMRELTDSSCYRPPRSRDKVVALEYESFDDLLADVQAGEDIARDKNSFSTFDYDHCRKYYEGWTNSRNMNIRGRAHQLEIVSRGYTTEKVLNYYEDIKRRLYANPDNVERLGSIGLDCRRRRRADLGGYIVNIDKAMVGIDPLESIKRQNESQCVRVFIDLARLAEVPPEHILESSALAIAVCSALEERGYATEIKFGTTNKSSVMYYIPKELQAKTTTWTRTSWVAKRPDEPVNETKLLTFSSSGIFRDFIFSLRRNVLGISIGGSGYAYVRPLDNEDFYKRWCDCDIYIGNDNTDLETIISNIEGMLSR